mmetsp:Transcript_21892/g.63147  ORF Transcript_21892/g.63147 Transcript_21892/m.63147 type:complete len:84 (-) Transcript_21892:329-580(-)
MDKLAAEYSGQVIFLLVNTRGVEDAGKYKAMKGLSDACVHGASRPPAEYGLRYIPHKTIINKDGTVLKNFDGVNLAADVKALV